MMDNMEIYLPDGGGSKEVMQLVRNGRIFSEDWVFVNILVFINDYLRYALGVVAMFVIVYAGIKAIRGRGKPEAMQELGRTLMWAMIGIAIAVFSAFIIRLIVNLF